MQVDLDELKRKLEPSEIIGILKSLIPNLPFQETNSFLIFPTICHNLNVESASMKLYYYYNTNLFFCYTECNDSFDIYELVKKILILRNLPSDFNEVFNIICRETDKVFYDFKTPRTDIYESFLSKYDKKNQKVDFTIYNKKLINFFEPYFYSGWIKEGISIESMIKYNIRYSISREQVIIPHYDIDGNLIGIRGRNLNEINILNGKYIPVKIEKNFCSHPLSYNLYGINFNKEAIKRTKTVFIFEGEKSVLLCDTWYKDNNVSVATCGNKLNKFQINLLLKLGVQNVVLCYDRMDKDKKSNSEYFNKLKEICKKYNNYMNFSFIYDRNCVLDYKASPVDSGQKIFEQLLSERVVI